MLNVCPLRRQLGESSGQRNINFDMYAKRIQKINQQFQLPNVVVVNPTGKNNPGRKGLITQLH